MSRLGHPAGGGDKDNKQWLYLHDFGLAAVGARGRHLHALDVLEVNPLQGLQAMAAQFVDHGRPCGEDRVG